MFKRFTKKDSGKVKLPSITSNRNQQQALNSGQISGQLLSDASGVQEGFLCAMCMMSLESEDALMSHYDHCSKQGINHNNNDQIQEGFLCAMCMMSLESEDALMSHYDHCSKQGINHNNNYQTQAEMEFALTHQQLEGSEESRQLLSSECHHLQQEINTLQKENDQLRTDKTSIELKATKLASEISSITDKADGIEMDNSAKLEHIKTLKEHVREKEAKIESIESQLSQSADDVVALKRELNQILVLMDETSSVHDKEKNMLAEDNRQMRSRLLSDYDVIAAKELCIEKLQMKCSELKDAFHESDLAKKKLLDYEHSLGKHVSDAEQLKQDLALLADERSALSSSLQSEQEKCRSLEHDFFNMKLKMDDDSRCLEDKNDIVLSLQSSLMEKDAKFVHYEEINRATLQTNQCQIAKLKEQLAVCSDQCDEQIHANQKIQEHLREKESLLDNEKRTSAKREERCNELAGRLKSTQDDIHRLESERAQLVAEMDVGDGAKVAMEQLHAENTNLQDKLSSSQIRLEAQVDDNSCILEGLHVELSSAQADCTAANDSARKLHVALNDKEASLISVQQRLHGLEIELEAQTETVRMLQLSTSTLKADRDVQISKLQDDATQSHTDLACTLDQLEQLKMEIIQVRDQNMLLELQIKEFKESISLCEADSIQLRRQLVDHVVTRDADEERISQLEVLLSTAESSLGRAHDEFSDLQTELQIGKKDWLTKEADFLLKLEHAARENQQLQIEFDAKLSTEGEKFGRLQEETQSELSELRSELSIEQSQRADEKEASSALLEEKDRIIHANEIETQDVRVHIGDLLQQQAAQSNELTLLSSQLAESDKQSVKFSNALEMANLTMCSQKAAFEKELQEAISTRDEQSSLFVSVQKELDLLKKGENEVRVLCQKYESDVIVLQESLNKEQSQHVLDTTKFKEAIGSLEAREVEAICSVKHLYTKLDLAEGKITQQKIDNDNMCDDLRSRNSTLQLELEHEISLKETIEQEKDESMARLEIEKLMLSDNLTALRSDLASATYKVDEMSSANDKLGADKVVLEAMLANKNDERRILLERCIASEDECEKLRDKTAETNLRLEDTQSALQELGRENQAFQITLTQTKSRKWTNDDDVSGCSACQKDFSVTVRKHHCRNCGRIFCNECSSNLSPLPSTKKPVRVCDACHGELHIHI